MKVQVDFSGGLELLFNNEKVLNLEYEGKDEINIRDLIVDIRDNHLKERPELFVQGSTVRPGILVLINEADWELHDTYDYTVVDKDTISFISTLHGGQSELMVALGCLQMK